MAESLGKPFPWAVGFFFGNTELGLELWTVIAGLDDTAPRTAKATGWGWMRKGSQVCVEGKPLEGIKT